MSARYGLPEEVVYCKRCVMSNQRPASRVEYLHKPEQPATYLHIDEEGVCDACRAVENNAADVDWESREKSLRDLLDKHRGDGTKPDCIVPGSGGKDSIFAAWTLKHDYGMTPLLVHWAPLLRTEVGTHNWEAWRSISEHYYELPRDEEVHRLLTRLSIERILHPFWSFIVGQKMCAAKASVQFDIPLVFYGETEALYGNPIADNATSLRDKAFHVFNNSFDDFYLGGVSYEELLHQHGFTPKDLMPYLPAHPLAIDRVGTEVHYLGWYLGPWVPQEKYYFAVEKVGYQANDSRTEGTFSKYNSLDDAGIDGLHYWTTRAKYGLGRATYDASQEIRNGHLDRDEAVALIRRYDDEFPHRYGDEVLDALGITQERFHDLCTAAHPAHLFDTADNLLHPVWE